MSEEQVVEQTQNASTEQPAAPEKQEVDTSKIFSKGYNEGKAKAERDLVSKFRSLGIEAEALEDAFATFEEKITPKKDQANEVDQLRKMLEEANSKVQQTQDEYEAFMYETRLEANMTSALDSIEGTLAIKNEHLKSLFYSEYEIEERDGKFFASMNGTPVLDNEGNHKSIGTVLREFAKENGYLKPSAQGAGGSSGHTQFSDKPSREEFQKLIRSKSADAQNKAAEMYQQAKKAGGWA
jgi:hypothetical protein